MKANLSHSNDVHTFVQTEVTHRVYTIVSSDVHTLRYTQMYTQKTPHLTLLNDPGPDTQTYKQIDFNTSPTHTPN